MIDLDNPRVRAALAFVGVRYVYGAGRPRDAALGDVGRLAVGVENPLHPGVRGWDCSGSALAYAVTVGDIPTTRGDMSAHDIANACDPVALTDARVGDFVFYDRNADGRLEHVAIYIGGGMVVSMAGGSAHTFGDDPDACGQVRPIGAHRVIGRWK